MKDNIKPICNAHDKPWQMSGHYDRTVNSKSNLTVSFYPSGQKGNTID